MTVTLVEIVEAAALRRASLVSELCGYLVLGVADACALAPRVVLSADVVLLPTGVVELRGGASTSSEACSEGIRQQLALLLQQSRTVSGALARLAGNLQPHPVRDWIAAIEAALIPVNRQAARRALERLHREVTKAREAGLLSSPTAGPAAAPSPVGPQDSHFSPLSAQAAAEILAPVVSATVEPSAPVQGAPSPSAEAAPGEGASSAEDTSQHTQPIVVAAHAASADSAALRHLTPRLPEATVRLDLSSAVPAPTIDAGHGACAVDPHLTLPLSAFMAGDTPPRVPEPQGTVPLGQFLAKSGGGIPAAPVPSVGASAPAAAPSPAFPGAPPPASMGVAVEPLPHGGPSSAVPAVAPPPSGADAAPAAAPSSALPLATSETPCIDVEVEVEVEPMQPPAPPPLPPQVGVAAPSHFPGRRSTVDELVSDFVVGSEGPSRELRRELQELAGVDASLTPPPVRIASR